MSTALTERPNSEAGNGVGHLIVRPQTVGIAAEQQRVQAEIQSRLMVAKSCRRDEVDAIDRIKTACQRPGLAEVAEYVYSRGGTEITGPTIDLLTVVANAWGNIDYGFRELSQQNRESSVECFAWDLETNAKRTVVVTVPHKRYTRNGSVDLTDPRDIYETVANYAQRRVRACLEAIIPPDVVAEAVEQCRQTLKASATINDKTIGNLLAGFQRFGVTKDQIEKRLGRRIETMQPAQYLSLTRIGKSLADGMSKPADWFQADEGSQAEAQTAAEAAKDALRKKTPKSADPPQSSAEAGNSDILSIAQMDFADAGTFSDVDAVKTSLLRKCETDADKAMVEQLAKQRTEALREAKKGGAK